MIFQSFYQRILLLVVGLVVVAQCTSFFALLLTLDRDVKSEVQRELEAGSELLPQLFKKRSQLLLSSAEVLAADYGFKSAIASRDPETTLSALNNNLNRIDADLATLLSVDGKLLSSTNAMSQDAEVYKRVVTLAKASAFHGETLVVASKARQVIVVPVKAPLTIAWLLLGFSLDDKIAKEMSNQLGMELSFSGLINDKTQYSGSTLLAEKRELLAASNDVGDIKSGSHAVVLGNESFLTRTLILDRSNSDVTAVLQISLQSAMESYRVLRNRLFMLAGLSLLVAIGMAFWMAHSITRPVQLLSEAASRIRVGDYNSRLELNRSDELGELADTFNQMQSGIAEREQQIVHQAFHDELTQLPNLRLARDYLQKTIVDSRRANVNTAVVVVSLDRFRQVTETLGHLIGDRLIQCIAQRITACLCAGDFIARISNDEFLIVGTTKDKSETENMITAVSKQVCLPVSLDAAELLPSLSFGIALCPHHGEDANELIRRANIALTDAREALCPLYFYELGRDENHLRQLSIVADLKRAVDRNELIVHYQPKITMNDRKVRSVEALVRWIHPEHGFMSPDEFIGLAEKSGNISLLSNWVLRSVIAQIAQWRAQGISVNVAVNLSAMDLQDDSLPDRICSYLKSEELHTADLIIEVTESAMMRDADKALEILNELKSRGITVSIDDFGTGYSSLSKLRDLPIDELKIDRSFIIDIKPDSTDALIVQAIIDLGHSMGMKITTEGIETQEEWDVLEKLGSDVIQGYLISKPLIAEELATWWQQHTLQTENERAA